MKLLSIAHVDYNGIENLVSVILNYMGKKSYLVDFEVTREANKAYAEFTVDELKYNYDKIKDIRDLFKYCYALGISDYIVDTIEKELLKKIIGSEYNMLNKVDKDMIAENIEQYNSDSDYDLVIEPSQKLNRKAKVLYEVTKFIDDNDHMDLEGFINFRLRFYLNELNDLVDIFVEKLEMEKEYNEFIKLLKYFIDIQPSKIDIVNLYIYSQNHYKLMDKNNNVIDKEYVFNLIDDFGDTPLSEDDFLISSLISLSPKNVVIHNTGNIKTEIFDTIYKIFDGRVTNCNDCVHCRNDNYNV